MSRRSRREPSNKAAANIPASVRAGIASFCIDNTDEVSRMLDNRIVNSPADAATALESIMAVNALSAEMVLARFFNAPILSQYSSEVLGKSGKGSAATLAARIAAVWGKPSFVDGRGTGCGTGASSGKKRSSSDAAACASVADAKTIKKTKSTGVQADKDKHDWRWPLFFWRGLLTLVSSQDSGDGSLVWKGGWVASDGGLPSVEQFENEDARANTFQMTAPIDTNIEVASGSELLASPDALVGLSSSFHGKYMLDQVGDGQSHQTIQDISHDFKITKLRNGDECDGRVVGATGTTKFGSFVSLGRVEVVTNDEGNNTTQLTLARRYIDEKDSRNQWANPQLVIDMVPVSSIMTPWDVLAWKCA